MKASTGGSFEVFVCDPLEPDLSVFELWTQGFAIGDVVQARINSMEYAELHNIIEQDIVDQFRIFEIIRSSLEEPWKSSSSSGIVLVQTAPNIVRYMIHRYYNYNDVVFRELIGNKLSTKARKDLDDVSEKTGVRIRSCSRQFDNLKRIYTTLDEMAFQEPIPEVLQQRFLLSPDLAAQYTQVSFLLYHRFQVQRKRMVASIPLSVLCMIAQLIMNHWTFFSTLRLASTMSTANLRELFSEKYPSSSLNLNSSSSSNSSSISTNEPSSLEDQVGNVGATTTIPQMSNANMLLPLVSSSIDKRNYLEIDVRMSLSIRRVIDRLFNISENVTISGDYLKDVPLSDLNEKWWITIRSNILQKIDSEDDRKNTVRRWISLFEPKFGSWFRALLTIPIGITNPKEFRFFFEEIVSFVVEPLFQVRIPAKDVELLFNELETCLSLITDSEKSSWNSYISVIRPSVQMIMEILLPELTLLP